MARQKAKGGPTIASLTDESLSQPPTSGGELKAFGGAPAMSPNRIDQGEKMVGAAAASGERYPTQFGGSRDTMIVNRPPMKRVPGGSASGARGAN